MVAKIIPAVVVRIMAGTYCIDIKLFHNFDILYHTFEGNDITTVRVHFMTVGSFKEYWLAVDEYLSACQFDLAETYLDRDHFSNGTSIFQSSGQCVEVGCFSSPFGGIGHVDSRVQFAGTFQIGCGYTFSLCVCQVKSYSAAAFHVDSYVQCTILILAVQVGSDADILNAFLVACIQIAVTSYAGITEEVLIFQITAVAPTEHLKGNQVFAGFQVVGQIKFGFQFAVFAIAYVAAVYPKIHIGSYRAEVGKDVFSFPVSRKNDFFSVRAYVIVFCGDKGRIVLKLVSPGIADIYVNRIAITIQFPNGGYFNIVPAFVVKTCLIKVCRACVCISYPVKFPETVQSHKILRVFFAARFSFISRCIGEIISVHCGAVYGIHFRVFPLVKVLCLDGCC